MEPILTADHLSVAFTRYGRGLSRIALSALTDLSLTVDAGRVTALVGGSGAGKSLLAHAVFHLLPRNAHTAGTICYDGAPLTPARARALRGREISLIPQGITYLAPMMKVGPQVRRGRRDGMSRARCREILARYGLGSEVEELYPFELSGGMARRVLIACAVMDSPRLIVADEPTPGLDSQTAGRVLAHFQELAEQGTGVLLITHDLELARTVAHKIVVLREGRTVDEVPAALFQTGEGLTHPYSRALWQAMPENGLIVDREVSVL